MYRIRRQLLAMAPVLILALLALSCARSGGVAPADFFKTKTLDWSGMGSPGDNLDRASRAMQPVLGKHLGTTVVITPRTGGGGLEAYNHVWFAEADGTSLALHTANSLVLNAMFDPVAAKYEPDKMGYIIGFPKTDPMMMFVAKGGPYTSLEKLKAGKNLKLGAQSPLGLYTLSGLSVVHMLDLDAKVIAGIKGSTAGVVLMMSRGELAGGAMAATQGPIHRDSMQPIFALGSKRSPLYPDIPALSELVKFNDPVKNRLLGAGDTVLSTFRVVFTSPNVPKERLEFLRNLFSQKVIPEARGDLERAFDLELKLQDFVSGQDLAKDVAAQWKAKDEIKQIFQTIIDKYRM